MDAVNGPADGDGENLRRTLVREKREEVRDDIAPGRQVIHPRFSFPVREKRSSSRITRR